MKETLKKILQVIMKNKIWVIVGAGAVASSVALAFLLPFVFNRDDPAQTPNGEPHTCVGTDWVIEQEATCTAEGSKKFVCSCGKTVKTEKILPIPHTEVTVPGKAATCTETGLTDSKKCSVCNRTLAEQTVIPPTLHTEEIIPGRGATCQTKGLTDGKKCSVCGETLVAQTEIPLGGHTEEVIPGRGATCLTKGLTDGKKCSVCGETLVAQIDIPLGDHTEEIVPGRDATCKERGLTEGKKCSVCGITLASQTELPLSVHTYNDENDAICNVCGFIRTLACKHSAKSMIVGKDVTCTESGLTHGVQCSACDEILVPQEFLPALGHDEIFHEAKVPTCTEVGWNAHVTCSRCSYTTCVEEDALGHDETEHDAKEPTCTEIGWDAYVTCSRCSYTTYAEESALGHDEIYHDAKPPTCTEVGWDAYVVCSRCSYTTYVEKDALGHTMVDGACTVCYYPFYIAIRTVEDLKAVSSNLSANYILLNDLDLGGIEWTPLGTFQGLFEGNGHVIENFKITCATDCVGFFADNQGVIQNLGIENFSIDVTKAEYLCVGGLVGYNEKGIITNCHTEGTVVSTTVYRQMADNYSDNYAGGLVGHNRGGIIENCYAAVDVSCLISSYSMSTSYAGGLVAYNEWGTVTNCYATGTVERSNTQYTCDYSYAGGLIGYSSGAVTDCYATGDVISTDVGSGHECSYAGGLVAYNLEGTVTNCYATGTVSSSAMYVGGLVGCGDGSGVVNCYRYSGQNVSNATNTFGTAVNMATLQYAEFHRAELGWSDDVWSFTEGAHPTLKNTGAIG